MKHYINIESSLNWYNLIQRINSDHILLNDDRGNFILGWNPIDEIIIPKGQFNSEKTQAFLNKNKKSYIFGYLSYDIKSPETNFIPIKKDKRDFNDLHFFAANHVIIYNQKQGTYFGIYTKQELNNFLTETRDLDDNYQSYPPIKLIAETDHQKYLTQLESIKNHIQFGNIYEMNYCVNFSAEYKDFAPLQTYKKLVQNAIPPFGAFVNTSDFCILSASPERFVRKTGSKLISQPIKGTAKRGKSEAEDKRIANTLKADQKERAENVMIVDLVRNDLSKIAKKNSVQVPELCEVYSFKTVHQLISTVTCEVPTNINFSDTLNALFPMGSMTGAPKIKAMEIIDEFENFSRGIYSGAIGYFDPNGNYDFNVVIRTIVQDKIKKTLSCSVGGAITIQSNPQKEYEECLLKLKAIEDSLC